MDNYNLDPNELKAQLVRVYQYVAKKLGIKTVPKIILKRSIENANDTFGYTGNYDSENKTINLFITGRHVSDILRSFCHELIHLYQDEQGKLDNSKSLSPTYAQDDPTMRKLEVEANARGSMLYRDFQDKNRHGKE